MALIVVINEQREVQKAGPKNSGRDGGMYNGEYDTGTNTRRNRRPPGFCDDGDHAQGWDTTPRAARGATNVTCFPPPYSSSKAASGCRATPFDFSGTEDLFRATKGASKD